MFSCHVPGGLYAAAVGTTGREDALTIDVGTLATLKTTASAGGSNPSSQVASVPQSAVPSAARW